jgi:hypothetical protein
MTSGNRARWKSSACGFALVIFVVGIGCRKESLSPEQPIHGKTLSEWSSALHSPQEKDRLKAVQALGNAGASNDAKVALLLEACQDRSARVRLVAVTAIQKLGPAGQPALPTLQNLLKDSDPKVREQSRQAMKQLEGSNPASR